MKSKSLGTTSPSENGVFDANDSKCLLIMQIVLPEDEHKVIMIDAQHKAWLYSL